MTNYKSQIMHSGGGWRWVSGMPRRCTGVDPGLPQKPNSEGLNDWCKSSLNTAWLGICILMRKISLLISNSDSYFTFRMNLFCNHVPTFSPHVVTFLEFIPRVCTMELQSRPLWFQKIKTGWNTSWQIFIKWSSMLLLKATEGYTSKILMRTGKNKAKPSYSYTKIVV